MSSKTDNNFPAPGKEAKPKTKRAGRRRKKSAKKAALPNAIPQETPRTVSDQPMDAAGKEKPSLPVVVPEEHKAEVGGAVPAASELKSIEEKSAAQHAAGSAANVADKEQVQEQEQEQERSVSEKSEPKLDARSAAASCLTCASSCEPEAQRKFSPPSSAWPKDEPAETAILPQICNSAWAKMAVVTIVAALCCYLPYWWYFKRTVDLPAGLEYVDVSIPSGSSGRVIANRIAQAGIGVSPDTLIGLLRVQGVSLSIHAGRYRFMSEMTLADIVDKLERGDVERFSFRIPDGQAIWELKKTVSALPDIVIKTAGMTEQQLREAIGVEQPHLEGVFAPETYSFRTGITDLDVYRAAYREQMRILDKEWENRSEDAVVKNKYEALILASIIEKETSLQTDRALVSSVFNNRLRLRMPLQTDPTVIYGIGENFNGNLTRRDMQQPGPYNTYLNMGLPPTPISMPTAASIHAALHPQKTKYLYFVARGDGTTHFSKTLTEHNQAVEKYQKAPARKARALQKRQNNAR